MEQNLNIPKNNTLLKVTILLVTVLGFGTSFIGGFFISKLLSGEKNVTTNTSGKDDLIDFPKIENKDQFQDENGQQIPQDSTKFSPGKYYYDDTMIMVTKDEPHKNLVATVTRVQQESDYVQNTRVSFYDGSKWNRKINAQSIPDSSIVSNGIVKSWNIHIDPSRVLREEVDGQVQINNSSVSFSSGPLQNEMSIRSLPGYTKFMSQGTGTLTVDGNSYEAYVLYTRIYSQNAADLQFYNQPFGVTTDWLAFWDREGNFYHIDVTNVEKPTPTYQTHQVGIYENKNKAVAKTFDVEVERDDLSPPMNYTIQMKSPLNIKIGLQRINELNKDTSGSFTWIMGNVDGKVEKDGKFIPGVGLIEYIYN